MKSNRLIILIPIIILADVLAISPVTAMLRATDDTQVVVGAVLGCLLLSVNVILIRTLFIKYR